MSEEISKVVKRQTSACRILPREDKKKTSPPLLSSLLIESVRLKCWDGPKNFGVHVNEHLMKKNAEIARNGRILRKQNSRIDINLRMCNWFLVF